ncbi:MAG: Ig-like domain-containing protein [Thermoleophilia bacterium]
MTSTIARRSTLAAAPPARIVATLLAALLAALAAVLVAVSLGGGSTTPGHAAFLARALGAPETASPVVRSLASGGEVRLTEDGYALRANGTAIAVGSAAGAAGDWTRFARGVSRETAFGAETVVVTATGAESFLTVEARQGPRTWRFPLATDATPQLTADGGVRFLVGGHRVSDVLIAPATIYDAAGRDVTPAGTRWALERDGDGWALALAVDDAGLPLPYVVDPAAFGGASSNDNVGNATQNGSTSLDLDAPAGTQVGDLLLAQVAVRGGSGTGITAPSGWTLVRRDDSTTTVSSALYSHQVASGETNGTFTWDFDATVKAAGGIIAWEGVDAVSPIRESSGQSGTSSSTVTAPGVTATAGDVLAGFFTTATGTSFAAPGGSPTFTERYDVSSTRGGDGSASSTRVTAEAATATVATGGATGSKSATAGSSAVWVGQLVALVPDTTPPAAPTLSIAEGDSDTFASGTTLFYRPGGAAAFTISATATDVGSGIASVLFPGLTGNFTPTTPQGDQTAPYSRGYSYTATGTDSGAKSVTATDAAGNTSPAATFTLTPDSTLPSGSITYANGFLATTSVTIGTTSDDGGSGVATTLIQRASALLTNGTCGTFGSFGGSITSPDTTVANGACYQYRLLVTDNVGNVATLTSTSVVRIDTAAPDTTIDAGPSGRTGDATPSFSFSSSEPANATFECRVDADSFVPCNSGSFTTAPLADGPHTFQARAIDQAGNVDPSPASRSITVDTTPPTVTLDPVATPTNDTTPGFAGTATAATGDSATVTVAVYAGPTATGAPVQTRTATVSAGAWAVAALALADGEYTARATQGDDVGNAGSSTARTFTVDTAAPDTQLLAGPSSPTNDADPTFQFTSTEPSGDSFECKVDAGAFQSCTSPFTTSTLADGSHTVSIRATDAAGNTDPSPVASTFTVDTVDPATTITAEPTTPTNDETATFEFTSDEPATFECRVGGAAFASCTSPFTTAPLGEGVHTFQARAIDAAGNIDQTPSSRTITVDLTAPATFVDVAPPDPTDDATPTLEFSASEPATFACSIDDGPPAACTSPLDLPALSDGPHSFSVRATDAAGNADPTPATASFTVDTIDPAVTLASVATPTADATPAFSGTAGTAEGDADTVVVTVRQGSSVAGAVEQTLVATVTAGAYSIDASPALADGTYTAQAAQGDAAGNLGTSAARTFRVDTTPPDTTITLGPDATTGDPTPTFQFSSSEAGATFACSLDGTPFAACTSPLTVSTALADGPHAFEVRATDQAGNADPSPASSSFTVDTSVPETTIQTGPTGPTGDATPTFTFTSPDASASFECKVDAAAFAACSSPFTAATLADGGHTFQVRALDAAANVDPTPATASFTVDTVAPTGSLTAPANGASVRQTVEVTATADDAGGTGVEQVELQRRVSTGPDVWAAIEAADTSAPYAASLDTTTLVAGAHLLRAVVRDRAGNETITATVSVTVDNTAPAISLSPITTPTSDATPAFSGTAGTASGDAASVTVDVFAGSTASGPPVQTRGAAVGGGGAYSVAASPALADGTYTARARQSDLAGNEGLSVARTFRVDTQAPETTIDSGPSGPTNDPAPTFGLSASETATFECRVDAGAFASCSSPFQAGTLADGPHTFTVRATDAAGNVDATPATRGFTVDTSVPTTSIDAGPSDPTNDDTPTLAFSSNEGAATFECRLDAGAFAACTSPVTISPALAEGSHTFRVRALDATGNVDQTPEALTFVVDVTGPDTSISSGPSGPTNETQPTFAFASGEPGTFECRLDGPGAATGTFAACTSPLTTSALAEGAYALLVRAIDAAGNADGSPATAGFTVDATAPAGALTAPAAGADVRGTIDVAADAADTGGTGVAQVQFRIRLAGSSAFADLGAPDTTAPYGLQLDTAALADGNYELRALVTDAAGNTQVTGIVAVTVDNTAPTGELTSPAGGSTVGGAAVPLAATASGTGSPVASVRFERRLQGAASFEEIGTDATSPYSLTWDTTSPVIPDGVHELRVLVTDAAGNQGGSAVVLVTVDNGLPTAQLAAVPAAVRGTLALSGTASDPNGQVASVRFQVSPQGAGTWTDVGAPLTAEPYAASLDTTALADGAYDLRILVADNAGNAVGSPVATTLVDNTAPTGAVTAPAASATVSGVVAVAADAADGAGSGVASVLFQARAAGGSFADLGTDAAAPYGASWDASALAPGAYELRVVVTDAVGNELVGGAVPVSVQAPFAPPQAGTGEPDPSGNVIPVAQCTIKGTDGPDRLKGTAGKDVICGFGGDDVIDGLGGDDVIDGADGNDRIVGGPGKDRIEAGRGNDVVSGGPGNDRINGGAGNDRIDAGGGDDTVSGKGGDDDLTGGAGRDSLAGGAGKDTLRAKDGVRDAVIGGGGRDRARVDRVDGVVGIEIRF